MLPFDKTLVIIPTYNEIDNIERMITTMLSMHQGISLLIIEDGSPDGTADVVKKLQKEYPDNLHMIQRTGKLGLGTAYVTGFKWALERSYEFVFEMDCDFSHDPNQVPDLLEAAQSNDLVIGSRYIDGIRIINWPFRRLLLSYLASIYTRFVTGIPVHDTTGGFKCFTRKALSSLNLDNIVSTGYIFQLELNYKIWSLGMKVKEVPIVFYERRDGQSKMAGGIIFEALFAVLRLRVMKTLGTLLK
ncbi:MAG: polyprenol monophosphomannose synthase [Deltaproteobacteria bacterium]|jgi:dolichol-phosphate mannosyltransferase|nr:MAG: polyprenol monophosphomannose synthase [Deltaproteobacteria bacterium]TNF26861.1 MAG: polyprenol monophosphomannose synthase [Deltaproteobacteria bacterium]